MEKDIQSSAVLSILIICDIILKNMVDLWDTEDYIF